MNEHAGRGIEGGVPPGEDDRIATILAGYVDRLSAGEDVDRDEIARRHPDLAGEIIRELETLQGVGKRPDASPGLEQLGSYRILRVVGRGGMGVVYEAVDTSLDRHVALKVLPSEFLASSKAIARFVKEARIAGRLHHPSIVPVYGMGVEQGLPYYAMEFVEGRTLGEILRQCVPSSGRGERAGDVSWLASVSALFARVDLARADTEGVAPSSGSATEEARAEGEAERQTDVNLAYCLRVAKGFVGVAEGLEHAHRRGIVHRDLKPSNLIVDSDGRIRIFDFGLARAQGQESMTASGDLVGTVLYMSPEQAMARRVPLDHRTDIYSLGATLYEMFAWEPPFRGRDAKDTLSQIMFREPRPLRRLQPRVPRDLETIVLKCLSKSPLDRYGTAEALAQDLRRFVRGDPIEARPLAAIHRLARRAWRKKALVASVCIAVLLVLTSALLGLKWREEEIAARNERYDTGVLRAMMLLEYGQARGPEQTERRRDRDPARMPSYNVPLTEAVRSAAAPDPFRATLEVLEGIESLRPKRPEAPYLRSRALLLLGEREEGLRLLDDLARGDDGFPPARILREIQGESPLPAAPDAGASSEPLAGSPAAGAPRPLEARPEADAPPWEEAYLKAQRAVFEHRREDATRGLGALLHLYHEGGEPFRGAEIEARLARGRVHLELRHFDEALIDFSAAEALQPGALTPALLVARVLFRRQRGEAALRRLEELYASTPYRDEAAREIVALLDRAKEPEAALRWSSRIEERALHEEWKALCLSRLERGKEALEIARAVAEREGGSHRAAHTFAKVLEREGRLEEAIDAYRRAVRLAPESSRCWKSLRNALLDRAKFETGEYREPLAAARGVLELEPHSASARARIGFIRLESGDVDEAEKWIEQALEIDPNNGAALNNMGLIHSTRREPDAAIEWFRKAIEVDPEAPGPWSNLGLQHLRKREYDQGIAACREALRLDPENAISWKVLGNNQFYKGEVALARDAFVRVAELKPKNAQSHYNLATVHERLGELDSAIDEYREAIRLGSRSYKALYNLGNVLVRAKRLDEAIAAYEKALELERRDPFVHYNLADALRKADRPAEAARRFRDALELDPGDPETHWALADVLARTGDLEGAREHAEKGAALCRALHEIEGAPTYIFVSCARAFLEAEPADFRDPASALSLATQAAERGASGDPEALGLLARAQWETGDRKAGTRTLEKAIGILKGEREGDGGDESGAAKPADPAGERAELRANLERRLAQWSTSEK